MKIDVRIISVLSRKESAERVADSAGISRENIVYDFRGPSGGGDAWANAKRAWLYPLEGATHRLILQDDVIPCKGFLEIVKTCVERYPESVWTFYNGVWITDSMKRLKTPYLRINGCRMSGQAICLPASHIVPMIEWSDGFLGESFRHDDARVGFYCLMNDVEVMSTIPSLCQHDMRLDSVIPNHHRKDGISPTFREDISGEDWGSDLINQTPFLVKRIWMPESARKRWCEAQIREKLDELRRDKNAGNNQKTQRNQTRKEECAQASQETDRGTCQVSQEIRPIPSFGGGL